MAFREVSVTVIRRRPSADARADGSLYASPVELATAPEGPWPVLSAATITHDPADEPIEPA